MTQSGRVSAARRADEQAGRSAQPATPAERGVVVGQVSTGRRDWDAINYRLLFERSADAILLGDTATAQFVAYNQAALDMLRCTVDELVGLHPSELSPPRSRTAGRRSTRRTRWWPPRSVKAGTGSSGSTAANTARTSPVEVFLTPLDSGPTPLLMVVWRDITDRMRAEEALRENERREDAFLATLSHALRNPLTPIRNALYVLERATAGGEQVRRAQSVIARQAGHLARLVDDLLDVNRITLGRINLQRERLDLDELVRRTADDFRAVFAAANVQLELITAPSSVWVKGDRTRLAQILGNLLQNAAKFTPPGERATVRVASE